MAGHQPARSQKASSGRPLPPWLCTRPRHKPAGASRCLPWPCPLSRLKHYPRWPLQRSQRVLDRQLENNSRGRISRRAVRCTRTPPACRDGHKRQQPTRSGPERFRRPSTCGSHEPHRKLRPLRTLSLNIYPSPTRRTNLAPSLGGTIRPTGAACESSSETQTGTQLSKMILAKLVVQWQKKYLKEWGSSSLRNGC